MLGFEMFVFEKYLENHIMGNSRSLETTPFSRSVDRLGHLLMFSSNYQSVLHHL